MRTHTEDAFFVERLIEKRLLPNGLTLEIRDRTRRMAGDRFLLALVFTLEVDILKEHFKNDPEPEAGYAELLKEYGPTVRYEAHEDRNFIGEKDLDTVQKTLIDAYLKSALPYLSKPDFARRLVLQKLREVRDPMHKFRKESTYNPLYSS